MSKNSKKKQTLSLFFMTDFSFFIYFPYLCRLEQTTIVIKWEKKSKN